MASTLRLGSRLLGEGQPCLVVAHVGAAHEGSAESALRLIETAFKAGADAIAFQIFRTEEVLVRRHPERPEMEAIELPPRDWRRVLEAARASGLAVLAEVLDLASRDVALEAGVDALQASASDLDHHALLHALAAAERPLVIGVGPAPERLVWEALDVAGERLALLLCPPAAPAPAAVEELRLGDLATRRERHRVPVGLLDSTDASSAFALFAPALAAAHGAAFVEKRLSLDRSRKGRDSAVAMSPEEFYRMVELLRQAERARGETAERGQATSAPPPARGRSIVAATLIGRGDVLTAEMLAFKQADPRFDHGLTPREADRVIGRRAARPIQADEVLKEDMLE
jgi:N,N'-diacetyllegionaminate synthase